MIANTATFATISAFVAGGRLNMGCRGAAFTLLTAPIVAAG